MDFTRNFTKTFLVEDRYKIFLHGFQTTLLITVVASLIGLLAGTLIAMVRFSATQKRKKGFGSVLLSITDKIMGAYVAIIRGTPLAIQLMIYSFIILSGVSDKVLVACVGFGLNSAGYVSEVIRAGILSVDKGQMEAGRSLGLNQITTMIYIILPQSLKNILPALLNEVIAVLKETSIVGLIAVTDLTRASDLVRSRTMQTFFPLISVAVIYFIFVFILSTCTNALERRLARSDRN